MGSEIKTTKTQKEIKKVAFRQGMTTQLCYHMADEQPATKLQQ
jgi:hypothetical protein